MIREEVEHSIEVMQAWLRGETIQYKHHDSKQWDTPMPDTRFAWRWDKYEYRVKPKPFETWANVYPKHMYVHPSKSEAENHLGFGGRTVLLKEVVDD